MKRIIACGLALLLLLSLFSACKEEKNDPKPSEETTEIVTAGFALRKDGVTPVFRYSIDAQGADFTLVKSSAEKLARYLGVKITRKDDSEQDPDAVEILFGDTAYSESALVKANLPYGGGLIRIVGNKLVIIAAESSDLSTTFDQFYDSLSQFKQESGDYLIPNDFSMTAITNETVFGLPLLAGKTLDLYDEGDNSYLLYFPKSTESDYTSYVNTFLGSGYRITATNDLEGNLFTTLTNDEKIVNIAWTPNTKDLRVMVDLTKTIALPNSESENVYDKSVALDTTITQIGLWDGSTISNNGKTYASGSVAGMSYAIRLSDGSFILIDGGYNTESHIQNLYGVLRKQAPDPEHIVIAAWIFSHAHNDHVGIVSGFLQRYFNKITVEKFIFNFPTDLRGKNDGGGGALETQVRNALKNSSLKNAKIIKAHAGQVDYIRNAKVEILLTLEMMEKKKNDPYKLSYYNDCSLIFKIEVDGQKLLFTGDCGPSGDMHEESFLKKLYTEKTLQADVYQLAHHGITDGSSNYTFACSQPTWAFVPAAGWQIALSETDGSYTYCSNKERGYNAPVAAMPKDHVLIAGKGIQMLTIKNGTVSAKTWETVAEYLA